ncbi:copper chaperone PCu(A)C [Brachybacterium hainanense]|uniref:Copper chaperone PCu(A)C n=1 Tax=Brachybacterium hainanense TaxID=1541174 RepID=A0ABV6R9I6_9MICO
MTASPSTPARIPAPAPAPRRRALLLAAAAVPTSALLAACGDGGSAAPSAPSSSSGPSGSAPLTVEGAWVKAAESGMTAGFATLTSTSDAPLTLIGARSPAAPEIQLHETAADGSGGMSMTQKEGGFEIPAGGRLVLEPGGDHLMFMDLALPLLAGDEVELTLELEGGLEVPVTAQIRDFAGAQEDYAPGMDGMDHGASDAGGEQR